MNIEYRLLNTNDTVGPDSISKFMKEYSKIKTKFKPNCNQCLSFGSVIVLENSYDPDAIISYRIPKKTNNDIISKFPESYQEKVLELKNELKLTQKQLNELYKSVKLLENQATDIKEQLNKLVDEAHKIKQNQDSEKLYASINKSCSLLNNCLNSSLATLDPDIKQSTKKNLHNLALTIDDSINAYLNK